MVQAPRTVSGSVLFCFHLSTCKLFGLLILDNIILLIERSDLMVASHALAYYVHAVSVWT